MGEHVQGEHAYHMLQPPPCCPYAHLATLQLVHLRLREVHKASLERRSRITQVKITKCGSGILLEELLVQSISPARSRAEDSKPPDRIIRS